MSENFPNLPAAIAAWTLRNDSTMADLARKLGVSKSTVTRWNDGEEPEVKRIREIADTLGVSVAYLAGEEDLLHTEEERALIKKYRLVSENGKKSMQDLGDALVIAVTSVSPASRTPHPT